MRKRTAKLISAFSFATWIVCIHVAMRDLVQGENVVPVFF